MLNIRRASDRGQTGSYWLDSRHSFSFGDYHDPQHMGFRALRVINEDYVAAGGGFPTHPHRDMEIITVVLDGALAHKDSLGNGATINPGEVQRMSAGTGIRHSEFNASKDDQVHLLQIWILPERQGIEPGYEQKMIDPAVTDGKFGLIASRDGRDGAVSLHQDADLYRARLKQDQTATFTLRPERHGWLQVAQGTVEVNGTTLEQGDAASWKGDMPLTVKAAANADLLAFDLA